MLRLTFFFFLWGFDGQVDQVAHARDEKEGDRALLPTLHDLPLYRAGVRVQQHGRCGRSPYRAGSRMVLVRRQGAGPGQFEITSTELDRRATVLVGYHRQQQEQQEDQDDDVGPFEDGHPLQPAGE